MHVMCAMALHRPSAAGIDLCMHLQMVVGTLMNICDDPTRQVFLSCCMLLFSTCVITAASRRPGHLPAALCQWHFSNCRYILPVALSQKHLRNCTVSKSPCSVVAALPTGIYSNVGHAVCQDIACRVSIAQEWRDNDRVERVPIIVTGNDLSRIFAPLVRDGRMVRIDHCAAPNETSCHAAAADEPGRFGRPAMTHTAEADRATSSGCPA